MGPVVQKRERTVTDSTTGEMTDLLEVLVGTDPVVMVDNQISPSFERLVDGLVRGEDSEPFRERERESEREREGGRERERERERKRESVCVRERERGRIKLYKSGYFTNGYWSVTDADYTWNGKYL